MGPLYMLSLKFWIIIISFACLNYISFRVIVTKFKRVRKFFWFLWMITKDGFSSTLWSRRFIRNSLGVCFMLASLGLVAPLSPSLLTKEVFDLSGPLTYADMFPLTIFIGILWEIGGWAFLVFMRFPSIFGEAIGRIFFSDLSLDDEKEKTQ